METKQCPCCPVQFRPTEKNPDKCDLCTSEGKEPPKPEENILVDTGERKIQRIIDKTIEKHIKEYHQKVEKIYNKKCAKCERDFESKSAAAKYCDECKGDK